MINRINIFPGSFILCKFEEGLSYSLDSPFFISQSLIHLANLAYIC